MWREDNPSISLGRSRSKAGAAHPAPPMLAPSTFLQGPYRFVFHYIAGRSWQFGALLLTVVGAAGCAVAVQYVMKLLVDGMAGPREASATVWSALVLFVTFIAG